ncbi:MAG: adenylate kinase family protein [Methanosarcinaceae archaeon]|nr:adenylate kinase family protein [Methanosarcinaceae archaeon]MDD4331899.1 adenylate kinase family protein [Methanosarcinaceae archaeon]MDD4749252.1 adenylate kinase family protein [Methanosarcinaceae archaeon]
MLIGLTGTPGTGKTSISKILSSRRGWKIIHLNELIREEHLYSEIDEKRDAVIADMALVKARLDEILGEEGQLAKTSDKVDPRLSTSKVIILESHMAHYIAELVIVLRAYPPELRKRLETRGYSDAKLDENTAAEALDVILVEAFEWCKQVFEVNTTDKTPEESAEDVEKIIEHLLNGNAQALEAYKPGTLDWIDSVP